MLKLTRIVCTRAWTGANIEGAGFRRTYVTEVYVKKHRKAINTR